MTICLLQENRMKNVKKVLKKLRVLRRGRRAKKLKQLKATMKRKSKRFKLIKVQQQMQVWKNRKIFMNLGSLWRKLTKYVMIRFRSPNQTKIQSQRKKLQIKQLQSLLSNKRNLKYSLKKQSLKMIVTKLKILQINNLKLRRRRRLRKRRTQKLLPLIAS